MMHNGLAVTALGEQIRLFSGIVFPLGSRAFRLVVRGLINGEFADLRTKRARRLKRECGA
jgi:hypothetical protein